MLGWYCLKPSKTYPPSTLGIITASLFSNLRAASHKYPAVNIGQSAPINNTERPASMFLWLARASRSPKLPSPCACQSTCHDESRNDRHCGASGLGVTHNSTSPTLAAPASATACRSILCARAAAPLSPNAEIRRVLANPGSGALAKMTMRIGFIDTPSQFPQWEHP